MFSQYFGDVRSIEQNLELIENQLKSQVEQNLSTVVSLTTSSIIRTSLLIVDDDGSLTPISDNANLASIYLFDQESIQLNELKMNPVLRIKAIGIDGQLELIVVSSIQDQINRRNANIFTLLLFIGIFSILGTQILRKLILKDVIREAEHLSLIENMKQQESKNRALVEFASETSHEIKTPLTIIKGNLQLHQMQSENMGNDIFYKRMLDEIDRIESNLNSLLTLMEFETIEEADFQEINISAISENEIATFSQISPQRMVVSRIEPGVWIYGSRELFLSIIRNVLSNIQRHAEADASVSCHLSAVNGFALLIIENSGRLDDTFSLDLLNINQRFNSDRAWTKGGSGLGLPIIHKAVARLNGRISLSKSVTGGLAVEIKIPLLSVTSKR